jgi:hypothetical protein
MHRRIAWISALGLVGLLLGMATAGAAPTGSELPSQDRPPTREAQVASCLAAADPAWSEPEHRVWQSLCNKKTADLSNSADRAIDATALGCDATFETYQQTPRDPGPYESDPRRRVSGKFLEDILASDGYARYLRDAPIRIIGAYITSAHVHNATIQSLRIDNSLIDDISLTNVKLDSSLSFCDAVRIKDTLVLGNVTAPRVEFYKVDVEAQSLYGTSPCFRIEGSSIADLELVYVRAAKIDVTSSHFDGRISMNENEAKGLTIVETGAGELSIFGGSISHLTIASLNLSRRMSIGGIKWEQFPERPGVPNKEITSALSLSGVSAPGLNYAALVSGEGPIYPERINFYDTSLGAIFLGNDPLALLGHIDQLPETVLDLYAATAKSYAALGRQSTAREILYQRALLADGSDSGFNITRWISRLVVGYGYYPERGLLFLFVFVLIGWGIFATGEPELTSAVRPHSWFVFSLDTVIPILALDPKNAEVSFRGFRQYYLYFMRLLGAGLAFLVFAYLKQTFVGPE